jgi:hypothetical protein
MTARWIVFLLPAALMVAGCSEGPPTQEELDAIALVQQVRGHVIVNRQGHAVRVEMAGIDIDDNDLAPLEKLPDVTLLSLEATPITDAGLVHVEKLTSLKRMSLRRDHITAAGLAHLKGLSSLEELDLEFVPLTSDAVEPLSALGALRKLYVGPDGPASAVLDALRSANPQLHIFQKEQREN